MHDDVHACIFGSLRRTIAEAARELKEKITKNIPDLDIPGYAKDKYLFALQFAKIKYPPFPTSPLALAFRPPIRTGFIVISQT